MDLREVITLLRN